MSRGLGHPRKDGCQPGKRMVLVCAEYCFDDCGFARRMTSTSTVHLVKPLDDLWCPWHCASG